MSAGPADASAEYRRLRQQGPISRPLVASALVIILVLAGCAPSRSGEPDPGYRLPSPPGNGAPAASGLAAQASDESLPRLLPDASVGPDLAALAQDTWSRFLAAFPSRSGCFGDVRLHAVHALGSRAAYDPATASVTILVPAAPAMLKGALVHEWAHHLDYQCASQRALRPAFLAAQGLPPDAAWQPAGGTVNLPASQWAGIPSEQFAEAAVELVLGSGRLPSIVMISPQAVSVVRTWGEGR